MPDPDNPDCTCSEFADYHPCPYACEIDDDKSEDYCNCCPECEHNCGEAI